MRGLLAMVALAAVVSIVGACSGSGDQAVFSFANDDLCEWVTEDEVAEFVAAEFDWEGTATEVEAVGPHDREATVVNKRARSR